MREAQEKAAQEAAEAEKAGDGKKGKKKGKGKKKSGLSETHSPRDNADEQSGEPVKTMTSL